MQLVRLALNTPLWPGPRFALAVLCIRVDPSTGTASATIEEHSQLTGHAPGAVRQQLDTLVAWGALRRSGPGCYVPCLPLRPGRYGAAADAIRPSAMHR